MLIVLWAASWERIKRIQVGSNNSITSCVPASVSCYVMLLQKTYFMERHLFMEMRETLLVSDFYAESIDGEKLRMSQEKDEKMYLHCSSLLCFCHVNRR